MLCRSIGVVCALSVVWLHFLEHLSVDVTLDTPAATMDGALTCRATASNARRRPRSEKSTIVRLHYRDERWPEGRTAPYQIKLSNGVLIYAIQDVTFIRADDGTESSNVQLRFTCVKPGPAGEQAVKQCYLRSRARECQGCCGAVEWLPWQL